MAKRLCDICLKIDEGTRHLTYHPADAIPVNPAAVTAVLEAPGLTTDERATMLADVYDTRDEHHHHECGAANGCGVCLEVQKG